MTELADRSAVELANWLHQGELSARELLAACLERIEARNSAVNAIVTLVADRAQAWAAQADAAFAAGETLGVLHGLPVAHKDLELTAGIRTTMGSPIFADFIPDEDGLVVQRLRAAGAITVGKTNVPEFGAGSHTFNPVFGATHNPYDLTRSSGGSSGGAAVALATGMVPLADGSDMGGSLRNPASFCNVVGLRPSAGRVPSWPNRTPNSALGTSGMMARSVDDLALGLQAIAGHDARVPIARCEPASIFADLTPCEPGAVRVGFTADLGLPVDRAVREALADVPERLAALGCRVAEASPDMSGAGDVFQTLRAWHFEIAAGALYDRTPELLKDTVRWNIELARRLDLAAHAAAIVAQRNLIARVAAFLERFDVLALPVAQVVPFDVDLDWPHEVEGEQMPTYIDWMRTCSDITLTECPAISMPAAFTPDGLPVGIQFVGRPGGDVELLRFAKSWESAYPVGQRRPSPVQPR